MGKNKNNKKKNIINLNQNEERMSNLNNNTTNTIEHNKSFEPFELVQTKKKNVFELLNDDNDANLKSSSDDFLPQKKSSAFCSDNNTNLKSSDKYFKLGLDYDDNNDFQKAIEFYIKSIEFDEDKKKGYSAHNLALIYENNYNDIEKAEKYYKIASNYNQNDSNCNIGLIYYNNSDYVNSAKYLKKYMENGGCDMFFQYAYCCNELNNYVEGMHYLTYHLMLKNADNDEKRLFKKLFIKNSE